MPKACYLHPHVEKRWINTEVGWGLFAKTLIKKGEVVGVFNRGVCALWFDGNCENAVKKIWKMRCPLPVMSWRLQI